VNSTGTIAVAIHSPPILPTRNSRDAEGSQQATSRADIAAPDASDEFVDIRSLVRRICTFVNG